MIDTLRSIQAGITAAALFLFMIAFVALLAFAAAPVIGEAWRKWRKRGKLDKVVSLVAVGIAIAYGATKPHVVPNAAGADDGIALVCIEAEYDSTNDVTAVNVKYTAGDVTVSTPVSVRNAESEQWRALEKIDATVTTGQTNVLAFAVAGNAATNRYWWVGVDTPAVIIESQGITITNYVATSKSVRIDWTCDDPKATVFAVQRKRKKPAGIPYDAEVECLESTGTQFIDTGVMSGASGLVIETRLYYDRYRSAYQPFFGARKDEASQCVRLILQASNNRMCYVTPGGKSGASKGLSFAPAVWHDVRYDCDAMSATIDGATATQTDRGTAYSANMRLFGIGGSAASIAQQGTRIAYFRAWTNGNLVRDYIAVRKSGIGYMYDRVSGQLFGNAGTGAFAYGSDTLSYDWETVDTTSANTYTFSGFTIGEDWEWRIMATYTEGDE